MDKRTLFFIFIFVVTLSVILSFVKGSLTGFVVQTMYCEDKLCREFCSSDSDCIGDRQCCDVKGMGVCDDVCINNFQLSPQVDSLPNVESPARTDNGLGAFLMLLTIATVIGLLYSIHEA